MGNAEPRLNFWTHPPDLDLQQFDQISHYARTGRMPWRRISNTTAETLSAVLDDEIGAASQAVHAIPAHLFETKLKSRFSQDLSRASIDLLRVNIPNSSAYELLSLTQKRIFLTLAAAFLSAFIIAPASSLIVLNCIVCGYFLLVICFRLFLAALTFRAAPDGGQDTKYTAIADIDLPSITILLPLHDESECLPLLSAAIDRLDYPVGKIDVKLLLEQDDLKTVEAARRLGLDRRYDMIVLPPTEPRTKPKACNHALYLARGELIVIYDAEDMPEADQLRKTAAVFANASENLACVQARLNYYNAEENWLTRLFALEYALWFDSLLPALEKIRAPIPLGGTSNFFRTDILCAIGGWDPHNVTEDADLGMRLARYGYRTTIVDSTTFEEANSRVGNWIRQRSRWMKGYLQTWLVHMREPGQFYRAAGFGGFLSTQIFLAGTVFSALVGPILWAAFVWGLIAPAAGLASIFPPTLATLNTLTLIAGNAVFIALAAIAPLKRGWTGLVPYALLAPLYWQLTSIAAYKAVWQLFTRPHYWEKTTHILSAEAAAARAATLRAKAT